jgi:hypothetical protein
MPSNLSLFCNISIQTPLAAFKNDRTPLRQPRKSDRHFARSKNTLNCLNPKDKCEIRSTVNPAGPQRENPSCRTAVESPRRASLPRQNPFLIVTVAISNQPKSLKTQASHAF